MRSFIAHGKLAVTSLVIANIYFIISGLLLPDILNNGTAQQLSFWQYFTCVNVALIICSIVASQFDSLANKLEKKGYTSLLILFTIVIISILSFITALIACLFIHYYWIGNTIIYPAIKTVLATSQTISFVVFLIFMTILMFFIANLERRSGNFNRFLKQSMGESLKPKLVQKGFIFIDLNNATKLGEELGNIKYANLLRDCFTIINELVLNAPFEIYQYVGDEALITWSKKLNNADVEALKLFNNFKNCLLEKQAVFIEKYNTFPKFKCAIHYGDVVQSEIGFREKHLVYHGDVLNTTSRLLSKCHFYKTDCIITTSALKTIEKHEADFSFKKIQFNDLRGKKTLIEAYAVSTKIQTLIKKEFKNFI